MSEYDYIDKSIPGLLQGLNNDVHGRFVAAEAINFGAPVFGYIGEDKKIGVYHLDVSKVAFDADFVTGNVINASVNGTAITAVNFTTDHLTTMNLLIAAIDGLTGVECVLDTTDVNNRTLLVRTKFADALVTAVVTGGASQAVATITYASGQVFHGISVYTNKEPVGYVQYDPVNVLVDGMISVAPSTPVQAYAKAYVDNAGANKGTLSNAGFEINAKYTENLLTAGTTVIEVFGKSYEAYAETF